MIDRLLLLGAAGDLATRHTLPALAHLLATGALPPQMQVIGIGREDLADEGYRAMAGRALAAHAPEVPPAVRTELVRRLSFTRADLASGPDLRPTLHGGAPVVAYLALPPAVCAPAVEALTAAGVPAGSRVVVEKPFGQDLQSARQLSTLLHRAFAEQDVFRVDHFLYHQALQDLLALRFATPLFEPLWTAEHIAGIDVVWEEAAGVSGRADFYDGVGALRDMVQSHLLQVLALVAMEPPVRFDATALRDAKAEVLRRVRSPTDVATSTARGRYTAGQLGGRACRAYTDEPGVDPARETETHVTLSLQVDVPRWRGVPFLLRTGKALGRARRRIDVRFRPGPAGVLSGAGASLRIEMAPDQVELEVRVAAGSGLPAVTPVGLRADRLRQPLPASARMIADVLTGDPTFTVRDDENEQCWRITEAVLAGWRTGAAPLQDYPAGSDGPCL